MADAKTAKLVKDSWKIVVDSIPGEKVSEIFYDNLFTAHPEARALFADTDMKSQRVALIGMIDAAVANVDNADVLIPTLEALGVRHAGYGCIEVHYDFVGEALILTLSQGLGAAFTPEVKAAWVAVYGVIKSVMYKAQQTPEGKRKFAAYEERQAKKAAKCCGSSCNYVVIGVVAAIAAIGIYKLVKQN
jgi:hemoglobin-like flavoprotein